MWVNTEHNLERNLLQGTTKAKSKTRLCAWLNCVNEAINYAVRKLHPKEYWQKQNSPVGEISLRIYLAGEFLVV